jgi:hypothetical protein
MHNHATIDRWSIAYWLSGNGSWSTRWECASADAVLCVSQLLVTLWVAWEYYRYATLCTVEDDVAGCRETKTHMECLRKVFLQCLAIHVAMAALTWITTPYFIIVGITAWNALTTRRLVAAKLSMQRVQAQCEHESSVIYHAAAMGTPDAHGSTSDKLQQALTTLNDAIAMKGM